MDILENIAHVRDKVYETTMLLMLTGSARGKKKRN